MSPWNRLEPKRLPYRIDALSEDEWRAACVRCDWTMIRPTYVSARAGSQYHYYVCPGRFRWLDEMELGDE